MRRVKNLNRKHVFLLVGDELVRPGIPQHKLRYVGPVGLYGEDVVDPAKGRPAQFVHLELIPDRDQLLIGERGTTDWIEAFQIQGRARDVVARGVVNRTFDQICEHIGSYIRHGKPESPQLTLGIGVGLTLLLLWVFGA
jgi:hypothetical protein